MNPIQVRSQTALHPDAGMYVRNTGRPVNRKNDVFPRRGFFPRVPLLQPAFAAGGRREKSEAARAGSRFAFFNGKTL